MADNDRDKHGQEAADGDEPSADDRSGDARLDDTDAAAAGDGGETDREAADLEEPPQAGAGGSRPSRVPLLLSIAALLLAAAAVGLALTPRDSGRPDPALVDAGNRLDRLATRLDDTTAALDDTEAGLSAVEQSLRELSNAARRAESDAAELGRTLNDRLRPLEAVPARLANLEASLSALQGISTGLRDTWLLAEAEHYLLIANAQLSLAGKPGQARAALELADERLASLANPALTDVRRAIAAEIRRIDAMDVVDLESTALTLSSLTDSVGSLPLKGGLVEPDFDDPAVSGELSGMDRALASLKASLSDVISVRRSDAPVTPLLPPDAAFFLRSNLRLEFDAARLALLEGEQALYEQSLDAAGAWLREYFDGDSQPVTSALATIDELRGRRLSAARPDISGSLALLRRFMALRAEDGRVPASPGATNDDIGDDETADDDTGPAQ